MGWQTESVMEQKQRFIQMWLTNEYTMSGLCKSFGISRTTGYKMIQRYRADSEYVFIKVQTRHIVYTYKGTWFTLFETHKLLKKSKYGLGNKKCHGTENTIY